MWERLSPIGRWAPFVYALVVAELAIIVFATLAYALADSNLIRFGTNQPAQVVAEPADALDFFSWHLLDSVPGLEITTTLRWDEPLEYDDSRVGVLLLVFKIIVIAPIVAAFASFWRFHRNHDSTHANAKARFNAVDG